MYSKVTEKIKKPSFYLAKQLFFVFLLAIITLFGIQNVNAQVTETTCTKDGIPVSWDQCLNGGGGKPVEKSYFPTSFYGNFFIEKGGDDNAYNLTIQRMVFDGFFILISLIITGEIVIVLIATIQRILAEDNEEKLKAAKKKTRSAGYALAILIGFILIGQLISSLVGVGNIWDIRIFR